MDHDSVVQRYLIPLDVLGAKNSDIMMEMTYILEISTTDFYVTDK
jgi:hypothetical protein